MVDPRGAGGGLVPLSTVSQAHARRPRGRGASGRRTAQRPALVRWHGADAAGEQAAAAFKREDNPRFRCLTTSILFDWTFDGPVNRITQKKDAIVIQYGQMGLKRTVYMDQKDHPASVKASRAGHSIGRWEGDVLVVDTARFLPGVLNAPVRHGDKLRVVERFTLDPQTMKLTRAYTATDPDYLEGYLLGLGRRGGGRPAVRHGQLQGARLHRLLEADAALSERAILRCLTPILFAGPVAGARSVDA